MNTACEFRFGFWDVTAKADAKFVVYNNQSFVDITDINQEEAVTPPNAATLEPDFGWPLDGSKTLFPARTGVERWGWWSQELSLADQTFVHAPMLMVTFSQPHSSAGITLHFLGTLPSRLDLTWYARNNNVLASASFVPDSFEYFCEQQVENYEQVVISIPGLQSAYRYLRVTHIRFGVLEIIGDTRVIKADLTEEINPATLTLPINTLEVSFFTPDGRFSLLDKTGAYKLFQWKQKIDVYKYMDDVQLFLGSYYLKEAVGSVDAATALTCVDMIGILDTSDYMGGIYVGMPLVTLLQEILNPDNIPFTVDPFFANVEINGYLPICTKREALQHIAFAIGAIVDPTRSESLRFYPMPTTVHARIEPARKINGHKITLEESVTQVDVTAHSYCLHHSLKELTKTDLPVGTHQITFAEPVSIHSVSGGLCIKSHPNYCTVQVETAGQVVISGYIYEDTTTVYSVKTSQLPAGVKPGVHAVTEATLVHKGIGLAVAQRLYDNYQKRYTDEGQLLPGTDRAAAAVAISSLGGRTITGNIQRVVTDLYHGGIETVMVRGN